MKAFFPDSPRSYRLRLMWTTSLLVVVAVFASVSVSSLFLTRYMDQQMRILRAQIARQDIETLRAQLSGINSSMIDFGNSAEVAQLLSQRSNAQEQTLAILQISDRIRSIMSSAEDIKALFLLAPELDKIVSVGSEQAETYLRYRITGDWESARTLKDAILGVQRMTYEPLPPAVMGQGYVLEIMPLFLRASSPNAYVCAVIDPQLKQYEEKFADAKLLCTEGALLNSSGWDGSYIPSLEETRAVLANDGGRISLNGEEYAVSVEELPFGNLRYVYLTSDALLNRHVNRAWLIAAAITVSFSAIVLAIALRCSRRLYQPVGTLLNAMVTQGRIAPGKAADELAAVGVWIDEVLMDNAKLNRELSALTPMLDELAFYRVLHSSEGPECLEWLNAFHERHLQLMVARLSHDHIVRQHHKPDAMKRMRLLVGQSILDAAKKAFCVRMAIVDENIYLVFSHDTRSDEFRLKVAAMMEEAQEKVISDFGAAVLYAVSTPHMRREDAMENADLLRKMVEQCARGFERCYLLNQSSGSLWCESMEAAEAAPALIPLRLENRIFSWVNVGKALEAWAELHAFFNDWLCREGVTGSAMKKLLTDGLDILYRAISSSGRNPEEILGNYAQNSAVLRASDIFEDAASYLQSLFRTADSALQTEISSLPVAQEDLDAYIRANWREDISLPRAAEHWNLSEGYFSRIVKNLTGESFPDYLNHLRVERARELMQETHRTIAEISDLAGFNHYKTFARCFRKFYGVSPSDFRQKQKNPSEHT